MTKKKEVGMGEVIFFLTVFIILIIGVIYFSFKVNILAPKDSWEDDTSWCRWEEVNETQTWRENAPEDLTCEELRWIIEHQAYPLGMITYARNTTLRDCNGQIVVSERSNSNPGIKTSYDNYYFIKCLTRLDISQKNQNDEKESSK